MTNQEAHASEFAFRRYFGDRADIKNLTDTRNFQATKTALQRISQNMESKGSSLIFSSDKTRLIGVTIPSGAEELSGTKSVTASTSTTARCSNLPSLTFHFYIIYSLLALYAVLLPTSIWLVRTDVLRQLSTPVFPENSRLEADASYMSKPAAAIGDSIKNVMNVRSHDWNDADAGSLATAMSNQGVVKNSHPETALIGARIKRSSEPNTHDSDRQREHTTASADDDLSEATEEVYVNEVLTFNQGPDNSDDEPSSHSKTEDAYIDDYMNSLNDSKVGNQLTATRNKRNTQRNSEKKRKNQDSQRQSAHATPPTSTRPTSTEKKQKSSKPKIQYSKRNQIDDQRQTVRVIHMHSQTTSNRQFTSPSMVSFNSSEDTVYRFWKKADWVPPETNDTFVLNEKDGTVFIKQPGMYLVYAQLVYHDLSGRWSFGIYVNAQQRVKCLASEQLRGPETYHQTSHGVYQHCYTAAPIYVTTDSPSVVYIKCMYGSRTILTQPEFTFWGIAKLS